MNGRRGEDIWEKAETDTDQYLEYMKMNKKRQEIQQKKEQRLRAGQSQKEEPKLAEEQEKMSKTRKSK